MMHEAITEFHVDVHDLLQDGDKVVAQVSFVGPHTGEFMGVPASGARSGPVSRASRRPGGAAGARRRGRTPRRPGVDGELSARRRSYLTWPWPGLPAAS